MALNDILSGAVSLGRSLLGPSRAVDVVAILGPGFAPIFSNFRPLVATVTESAQLMEHPLETGAVIADHIVFDPMEIELPGIVRGEAEYRNTYAAVRATFKAGTLLTIVTRTGVYPSMVIYEMPHEERPQSFDAVEMSIRLRHAVFVTPQSTAMSADQTKDAKQASTTAKGAQQTTATNAAKSSAASSSYSNSGAGPTPSGSKLYQWTYGP